MRSTRLAAGLGSHLRARLGLLGMAAALGLTLATAGPSPASAMPCGPVKDNQGNIINWIDCGLYIHRYFEPEPCRCPDVFVSVEDMYDPRWNDAVVQDSVAVQPAGGLQQELGARGFAVR